ncbi:MAG: fatty acid desaturase family protein [Granulosicoccus sp.]
MRRSDKPALLRLALWVCLVGFTGFGIWLSQGSWLMLPAMFIHGVVLVHHFSLQHECCHYTAFKTRWLNDFVGNICGLVIMLPNRFFRYEHCDHHTYTQIKGHDTELIELPRTLAGYFYYLSSIPYWKAKLSELARHAYGQLSTEEKRFIPNEERKTIVLEARLMVAFYILIVVLSMAFQSTVAIWYWFVPVVLGEPVMRAIRMTEHVGRPTVSDMKVNTRSNLVSWPMRFLCWNMNYHAEHHYASSVPFHALPRLNRKLDGYVHTENDGYVGAHRDIVSQLLGGRTPRSDNRPASESLDHQ